MKKKALFTIVFSVYCFIFYSVAYFLLKKFDPAMTEIPDKMTADHFLEMAGVFTAIVFLAFTGASYIVYGNASGRDESD